MGIRKIGIVAPAILLLVSVSRAQPPHQHEISPSQGTPSASIAAESFRSLMMQAMERMHRDMSIVPSGNPDRDFAAMMIPHHQGAVDMAKVELQACSGHSCRTITRNRSDATGAAAASGRFEGAVT